MAFVTVWEKRNKYTAAGNHESKETCSKYLNPTSIQLQGIMNLRKHAANTLIQQVYSCRES